MHGLRRSGNGETSAKAPRTPITLIMDWDPIELG